MFIRQLVDRLPMPKADVERVTSGIPGLDKLISGGFVKGSTILVTGGAGTGKTIFCSQYIWEGLQKGENCMLITLEEKPQDIKADVAAFGWDFESYEKKGKLVLDYKDPFEVTDIVAPLVDKIKARKIQRVAIDSTSTLGLYFNNPFEVRKQLFKLLMALKNVGVTSVLTAEITNDGGKMSRFGVEEFITDGVIMLNYLTMGGGSYLSLQVRKMRQTAHAKDTFPMDITDKGIVVKKSSS